ncbi:FRG domain-containing protein [Methylocaldum sp. 14B]|jgi:hypothetical protein|uniref:FRG domain-containing protein n=1 Tax=Methylocaldum sp. 14B TaxID=1912213 RepID=UPI000989D15C|nr:FRG domain-containing protein [Methylocaldum sp. 14B]
MEQKTIKCWHDLANLADEFKLKNWIFRGVEDSTYELVPKVGRSDSRKNLDGSHAGYSAEAETLTIDRFQREARPHLGIEPRSNLDWLSIAQHHGLPTRLLDWSESPLVAAYFALRPAGILGGERKDAAIYGHPALPIVKTDEDCKKVGNEVFAYYPQHLTPRITAQRGLFTYHEKPEQPFISERLVKWIIPSLICFDLKLAVSKCGINEASMFPDLDGLAKHVGWLHKWSL